MSIRMIDPDEDHAQCLICERVYNVHEEDSLTDDLHENYYCGWCCGEQVAYLFGRVINNEIEFTKKEIMFMLEYINITLQVKE